MFIFLLSLFVANAGNNLDQVRLYTGEKHVRVLIRFGSEVDKITTQSLPAINGESARVFVKFSGPNLSEENGYTVENELVERLLFMGVSDGIQLTATLHDSAVVKAQRITEKIFVVDILENQFSNDPTIPSIDDLTDWINGVAIDVEPKDVSENYRIVLDPGHGGWAHGAIGYTGTRESDIALELSYRIKYYIEQYPNVEVIMTREDDTFISLSDRALIANTSNADIFLSIHANAAESTELWGIETYSMDTASDEGAQKVARRENSMAERDDGSKDFLLGTLVSTGTNILSKELSQTIQTNAVSDLRSNYGKGEIRDLGDKTALFYVLVSTTMPAVLFEASFISNPADERRLRTPHFQNTVANSISTSVYEWLESQH